MIQALQTLRGVAEVKVTSLVAEIGEFGRFRSPAQFDGVCRTCADGVFQWLIQTACGITKCGNAHLRRVLGEAAWSYRYKPAVKRAIRQRQEGQSPQIQDMAWRAQDRLHRKYVRMVSRGKQHNVVVTAGERVTWIRMGDSL